MLGKIMNKVGPLPGVTFARSLLLILYHRWKRGFYREPTLGSYIFKTARVTGTSEYEVFCKSAENWPVTVEKIERDFSAYLIDHRAPYYVRDFIRKNQKHIDDLRLPLF